MKKHLRFAIAAACAATLLVCLVGCGTNQKASDADKSQESSTAQSSDQASDQTQSTDARSTVKETVLEFEQGQLAYGGSYVVAELEENLTTGYEWTVAVEGTGLTLDDQGSVTAEDLAKAKEATGEKTEVLTGEGGYHVFGLQGDSAGTQTVTFTYARSWEKSADDVIINATVETDGNGNIVSINLDMPFTTSAV